MKKNDLNKELDAYKTPEMSSKVNADIIEQIKMEEAKKTPFVFMVLRRGVPKLAVLLMIMTTYSLFFGPQSTEREIAIFLNETIALDIYEAEIADALVTYEDQKEFEIFLIETDML